MNKILSNSYTEVSYILNLLGDDYKSKIPSQILKCIYNNKNNNYKFNIDTNIEEANISRNALIIISIFNLKYWENDEVEKERLRKIYNINEQIFQKKINEYKNNDWLNRDRKNLNYVIEEKSLIIKDDNSIWSKIKNFFKRILKK